MTAGITGAAHRVDAATVLGLLPARPRLLGVGEPTHGDEALLALRNDLFGQLVEQAGYRTIAIESDCLLGQVVDDYVTSGTGRFDEVMRCGFSHEWGAFAGNRDLVRWMRAYNQDRPPAGQVRFAGFDGPLEITHAAAPRVALTALHTFLTAGVDPGLLPCTAEELDGLLGADERWTNPAAMRDPAQSVGRTPDAARLRLLADDLVALLDAQAPHLLVACTADDRDRVHRAARTATGLLRYHHWMADPSPGRLTWLVSLRDAMMAANLLALAERGPTLVSGHNAHLQRHESSMWMAGRSLRWFSAGAIAATHLGAGYAFVATAVGTIRRRGVDTPPADTLEGLLYALAGDRYVVDPRGLAGTAPVPRVSPWFGYAPLDPAHLAGIDAILFVKDGD
jgi:erythromycin esterase-like protein